MMWLLMYVDGEMAMSPFVHMPLGKQVEGREIPEQCSD
jgi:hypothetical protein